MELTELQQKVFDAARAELKGEPWFQGICMDDFPEDEEILEDFDSAVSAVIIETMFWDGPSF